MTKICIITKDYKIFECILNPNSNFLIEAKTENNKLRFSFTYGSNDYSLDENEILKIEVKNES